MNINNAWFLEYSVRQKSYHYNTFNEIIASNRKLVNSGSENGYVIIGGPFNTMEEAMEFRKEYQKKYNLAEGE